MTAQVVASWLDIAARIKAEWGMPLFVAVSYTLTSLFAISQVRAIRLDRQYRGHDRPCRIVTRLYAFGVAAPAQTLVGYLWGYPIDVALTHGVAAGIFTPVVADLWIALLRWRGCEDAAEVFKVKRRRRASDMAGDDTQETRL